MKNKFLLIGLLLACSAPLWASATPWEINKHGQVRLICPYMIAPRVGSMVLGIQFKAIPGWHLYWKNPGDAGLAPKFTWDGSSGISGPTILWPTPQRYILPGNLVAIGYENEVVYPIRVQITGTPSSLHLVAHVSYLTCNEACVPYKYTLTLDVPAAGMPMLDGETSPLIDRFLSQIPAADRQGLDARAGAAASSSAFPLAAILGVGFLGGLILNIMPCVLPVLAIKLLGLLRSGGKQHSLIVRNALASAAGILVSFLALAIASILLRHAGHAVGWGIQFQQPLFVGLLAVVVFVFAFNLFGFFEIGLPGVFGHFATTFGRGETLTAYFASGVFATLLATPCSAPFLGTALGFALSQPAAAVLAIFMSAGAGMALPYFALAVFPGAVRWLPKPGPWMQRVKQFLGLLLVGTGVWLLMVLYSQLAGRHAVLPLGASSETSGLRWVPFDESQIQAMLQTGDSVFVDVTADWCFTCKYNEKAVLQSAPVAAALRQPGLILMRADWTNPNPAIEAFLKRYGRAGIPFYALFRPGKEPVLLSEFLTKKKVLDALAGNTGEN